jgi:hypothetical protein
VPSIALTGKVDSLNYRSMSYREGLATAGLVDDEVVLTHSVADGMHSAIVRARKPGLIRLLRSAPAEASAARAGR